MTEIEARPSQRPLIWPDMLYELQTIVELDVSPVYVVGGAVRDAWLQRPVTDLDLTVPQDAVALARRLANAFQGEVYVMDRERDVARALMDTPDGRLIVDVARFRGEDLLADLHDRDFTINAMAVDLRGDLAALIDPLNGEQDLRDKLLRRCHAQSISDDPIRALRAVRQSVQFGLRIEPQTVADIHGRGSGLTLVSPERVRDEFTRLLSLPTVRQALRVAEALGLLAEILPELDQLKEQAARAGDFANAWQARLARIEKLAQLLVAISPARSDHTAANFGLGMLVMQLDQFRAQLQAHIARRWPNDRSHQALLILAVLLDGLEPAQIKERAAALRLSNDELAWLLPVTAASTLDMGSADLSPLSLHRFWYRYGEAGVDICLLVAASWLSQVGQSVDQDSWLLQVGQLRDRLYAYYERFDEVVSPPGLLDGGELMAALGLKSGPVVGELLQHIREAQVTGEVGDKDTALMLARAYLTQLE